MEGHAMNALMVLFQCWAESADEDVNLFLVGGKNCSYTVDGSYMRVTMGDLMVWAIKEESIVSFEEKELTPSPSSLTSPPTSHPESSLAYSPPTMATKRLNLPINSKTTNPTKLPV